MVVETNILVSMVYTKIFQNFKVQRVKSPEMNHCDNWVATNRDRFDQSHKKGREVKNCDSFNIFNSLVLPVSKTEKSTFITFGLMRFLMF